MSLANLAVLFSKQSGGKKVLMIDWDLEAPGLHEFFKGKINETELKEKEGVIELFELAKRELAENLPEDDPTSRKETIALITKYFEENLIRLGNSEHLEMLQAGRPGPEYAASVQMFDWREFFDTHYAFFPALIEFLKSRWDYVLIDSRTGLTDTGGICTAILPEALITVFTPTRQGLKVTEMIERALSFRKGAGDMRPLVVYPLVSRVDASEEDRNREWKEIYTPLFQDLFKRLYELPKCDLKRYFGKVEIHYVRKYAYGEQVSVLEPYDLQNRFELPARYNELALIIIGSYLPWDAPDLPDIPMTDANRVGYYAVELQNNGEYKRAEQYFQKAIEMNPKNADHLSNYALYLHESKKDYESAEVFYKKTLDTDPNLAMVLGNYANFLGDIRKDYESAEAYYRKAIEIDPNLALHLGNFATFLLDIKKDFEGAEAYYRKSLELDPNDAYHLGNYASFLQIKKDYVGSEAYYRKALKVDPNDADNLGNYASFLSQIKKDYIGSEAYYRKALEAEPDDTINLSNYAQLLFWTNRNLEAEEKISQVFALNPNQQDVLCELWFYRYAHTPTWREQA
ncbi:MAG: tetratricopeptide repeat protein, partial [Saprospiraceae bacterium]|nr:tetratricopeptide repeat protein [Saprospiraceae bacterium]